MSRVRARGDRRDFCLCIVSGAFVTSSKKFLSCLVFLDTFSVKGVDTFKDLVDRFSPVSWKRLRMRNWSAYLRPLLLQ